MEKIQLLIENVKIYNSYFKTFYDANVAIKEGRIYYIDRHKTQSFCPDEVIDGQSHYMIPGFIDIHMHIESSMMTPKAFCQRMASCGVTTIVSEPHEMANVNGVLGVMDMIEAGKDSPISIFYGIPSCVPSTSTQLETTGGIVDYPAMKQLMELPEVICVGEVMNYRQIIKENDLEITKMLADVMKNNPHFPIEGHCPSLVDLDLAKFLFLGINGDHTEHSLEEIRQRFENGMFVEIQEKMLKPELFDFIKENNLYEYFGFVTDDVMADTLYEKGHIDCIIRKAIKNCGLSPQQAVYNATYTNANRMGLTDRGVLVPGKLADFVLVDDIEKLHILSTYKEGRCIFTEGERSREDKIAAFPQSYYHSIKCNPIDESILTLPIVTDESHVKVRVMEVVNGGTQTKEKIVELPVENQMIQWEGSSCLLAVVIERYGKGNEIGYGLVTGDCLKEGAVATTYAHDHHNLLVVGSNPADMVLAANEVIAKQGGMVVANAGEIKAVLPLPIGGILSQKSAKEIGLELKEIRNQLIQQGYNHYNPIMSLCTLSLPVSPALKITNKGLIDVKAAKIVDLVVKQ